MYQISFKINLQNAIYTYNAWILFSSYCDIHFFPYLILKYHDKHTTELKCEITCIYSHVSHFRNCLVLIPLVNPKEDFNALNILTLRCLIIFHKWRLNVPVWQRFSMGSSISWLLSVKIKNKNYWHIAWPVNKMLWTFHNFDVKIVIYYFFGIY